MIVYRSFSKQIFAATLTLIALSTVVNAQNENSNDSKFGISAALQSEQLDLLFPVWANHGLVIIPSISFVYASDIATEFGLGLGIRGNFRRGDAVPYAGVRSAMIILSPETGNSINDIIFGPFAGGEYFVSEHFSFSVEVQLNFAMSDDTSQRFGNPDGTNINTATLALATFYF